MGFKTNHITGKRTVVQKDTGDVLTAFNAHKADLKAEAESRAVDMAAVRAQEKIDKAAGNQKLLDLGLSQAEVDALTKK